MGYQVTKKDEQLALPPPAPAAEAKHAVVAAKRILAHVAAGEMSEQVVRQLCNGKQLTTAIGVGRGGEWGGLTHPQET